MNVNAPAEMSADVTIKATARGDYTTVYTTEDIIRLKNDNITWEKETKRHAHNDTRIERESVYIRICVSERKEEREKEKQKD